MNKKFLALLLTSCSAYAGNPTATSVADFNDSLNSKLHPTIKIEDSSNLDYSFIELPKAHGGYSSERIVVDNIDQEHSFINITSVKNSMLSMDDIVETSKIVAHSPVTHRDEKTDQITVSKDFVSHVSTYADMIDLSYHLVKGRNELTTSIIEKLLDNGWQIKGFTGFSGIHNDKTKKIILDADMIGHESEAANTDLAGFIAFNKSTGEAVVTFHGSQDKFDWQNNLQ